MKGAMQSYDNYFDSNPAYQTELRPNSDQDTRELEQRFGRYMSPSSKVLEIGTGLGTFANFCLLKGIKNYVGIEVDKGIAQKLSHYFSHYHIISDDALGFLKNTTETFDIIFMSHVFEHFSIEDGINLANLIRKHLTSTGIRINVMPNAGCITGCLGRYNDITHKTIYSSNSFNQVLSLAGFKINQIKHFNMYPQNPLKRLILWLMGRFLSVEFSTFQLMSVIKKS